MTLLFLHGAGFTGACFERQLEAFAGAHAPDMPGHCRAGAPASIDEFARAVAQYAVEHDIGDAVLCGHSMGGAVALTCALRRLLPVRGVILLGGGARLRVAPAILQQLRDDFEDAAAALAAHFFHEPTPERIAWAVASMRAVGASQTIRDFEACDAFDVLSELDQVAVPLLAVTGEHDVMTPPKYAHALADRVRDGEARIVPRAGHFVMVERPQETNAAIGAFLKRIA